MSILIVLPETCAIKIFVRAQLENNVAVQAIPVAHLIMHAYKGAARLWSGIPMTRPLHTSASSKDTIGPAPSVLLKTPSLIRLPE